MNRATRILLCSLVLACAGPIAIAAPRVPLSEGEVLERLPEARDPVLARLKMLRAASAAAPEDLRSAAAFARASIDAARATGDPRHLGRAQAVLAPWWSADDAPPHAMVLRATIKQSLHDFDGALADLDRLLARVPADAQARLTRATVRAVVGRHADARADCERLAAQVPSLVAAACVATADGATARAPAAETALDRALASNFDASPAIRTWAYTLAAELAARRGDAPVAEARFRAALALDPADAYLLGAYADWLLDRGRDADVVVLLRAQGGHDGLLLRRVIAAARVPALAERSAADRAELAARVDATRRRGDVAHLREEARYALAVEGEPARALALARANFALQKEPADLRLLHDAAVAANDAKAREQVRLWVRETGLADVALAGEVRR